MKNNNKYQLTDDVLRHIVQLLQEALLTGTDVTDHLRMIQLQQSGEAGRNGVEYLELETEYKATHDGNVQRMVEEAEQMRLRQERLQNSVIDDPTKFD